MIVYALADLHLGEAVDKPMDLFGSHWDRHAERIKEQWEALVQPEDIVLIPGDISWGINLRESKPDLAFIHQLPGQKILSRGNHDYWWPTVGKLRKFCADEGFDSLVFQQNDAVPLGERYVLAGTRLWNFPEDSKQAGTDRKIFDRELIRLELSLEAAKPYQEQGRELVVMTHYPPVRKHLGPSVITERLKEAKATKLVFGHIHQRKSPYAFERRQIDGIECSLVAADFLDFKPWPFLRDAK